MLAVEAEVAGSGRRAAADGGEEVVDGGGDLRLPGSIPPVRL